MGYKVGMETCMNPRPVAAIRNGLVLAATTPAGLLRVPTTEDIGDYMVLVETRDGPASGTEGVQWLIVTRSTGCPPGCSFVPPVRLQTDDHAKADELGEALLCVGRAA